MNHDRDNFETYAVSQGLRDFERNEFDDYRNPFTQQPWCFWKASRDALAQDGNAGGEFNIPPHAFEINRLRNVIQAACTGGLVHMIERWKELFPDAPVPTLRAALSEAPAEQQQGVPPSGSGSPLKPCGHAAIPNAEDFVRSLLWDHFPECCGSPVVGAEYMGQREMVCCGCPEPVMLNDRQIVASLRECFPAPAAQTESQP